MEYYGPGTARYPRAPGRHYQPGFYLENFFWGGSFKYVWDGQSEDFAKGARRDPFHMKN